MCVVSLSSMHLHLLLDQRLRQHRENENDNANTKTNEKGNSTTPHGREQISFMTIVANRGELDCKDVFDFAAHGDKLAKDVVDGVVKKIGKC